MLSYEEQEEIYSRIEKILRKTSEWFTEAQTSDSSKKWANAASSHMQVLEIRGLVEGLYGQRAKWHSSGFFFCLFFSYWKYVSRTLNVQELEVPGWAQVSPNIYNQGLSQVFGFCSQKTEIFLLQSQILR